MIRTKVAGFVEDQTSNWMIGEGDEGVDDTHKLVR